jgi:hypothetical protein
MGEGVGFEYGIRARSRHAIGVRILELLRFVMKRWWSEVEVATK